MILRAHLRVPVKYVELPTFTSKWDITEIAYYVVCDAVSSGIKDTRFLDETINGIYNWVEALVDTDDFHLVDLIVQHVYRRVLEVFNNRDFLNAINAPYELVECSARVCKGERNAIFYFKYEIE